mgnify:CR=1 FL=1
MFEKSSAILILCEEQKDVPTRIVAESFIGRPLVAVSISGCRTMIIADDSEELPINEEATHVYNDGKKNGIGFIYGNAFLLERDIKWH